MPEISVTERCTVGSYYFLNRQAELGQHFKFVPLSGDSGIMNFNENSELVLDSNGDSPCIYGCHHSGPIYCGVIKEKIVESCL